MKDHDYWVRGAAVEALGEIRDKQSLASIIEMLKDEDVGVRQTAISVLDNLSDELFDPQAVETLAAASRTDTDEYVRTEAKSIVRRLQMGKERKLAVFDPTIHPNQEMNRHLNPEFSER